MIRRSNPTKSESRVLSKDPSSRTGIKKKKKRKVKRRRENEVLNRNIVVSVILMLLIIGKIYLNSFHHDDNGHFSPEITKMTMQEARARNVENQIGHSYNESITDSETSPLLTPLSTHDKEYFTTKKYKLMMPR